jgi:hypothetical protein
MAALEHFATLIGGDVRGITLSINLQTLLPILDMKVEACFGIHDHDLQLITRIHAIVEVGTLWAHITIKGSHVAALNLLIMLIHPVGLEPTTF